MPRALSSMTCCLSCIPPGLPARLKLLLGGLVILINAGIYLYILRQGVTEKAIRSIRR